MVYNKDNCSPKSLKENIDSCLNIKLIKKIAYILNKNPNCDNIDCESDTKVLYKYICNNINKISTCNSEYCWLTIDEIVKKLNKGEINEFNKSFRPKLPSHWKGNNEKDNWLDTDNINNVMVQYEDAFKDFKYLGAHPIDAQKCSISKEICNINIETLLKNGKNKVGIVFNTDISSGEGEHWVSFYIDLLGGNHDGRPGIYFFDSTGDEPQEEINKLVDKLKKQGLKKNIKFDFLYNDYSHQKKDSECGIYCLYFLSNMISGVNFDFFIKDIKNDKYMNKYRKIFYVGE
jgi:hypothetical protein